MTNQKERAIRGIEPWVIKAELEIYGVDNENMQALVEGWTPKAKSSFKTVFKYILDDPSLKERLLDVTAVREPGKYTENELQAAVNMFSFRIETIERLYRAISAIEQSELQK